MIILADDFGVSDIQAHYPENKIATPHLDRLVREGSLHIQRAFMNRLQHILTWLVVLVTGTLADWPSTVLAADKPFTHPGILHSRAELDFVKARVAAGEEPWKSAWEELRSHGISRLDWKPKPAKDVVRGSYNNPDIGGTDLMRDAAAAYSHAIQWHVTGEQRHADKAIEILNAYSSLRTRKSLRTSKPCLKNCFG